MGRRNVINGYTLETAIDLTQASYNVTSTHILNMDRFAYMLEWSSLLGTGEVKVQGGIKTEQNNQGVIKWADLDLDPVAITGSSDTALINISSTGFEYIRLVYTKTDATAGTLNVYVSATVQGA